MSGILHYLALIGQNTRLLRRKQMRWHYDDRYKDCLDAGARPPNLERLDNRDGITSPVSSMFRERRWSEAAMIPTSAVARCSGIDEIRGGVQKPARSKPRKLWHRAHSIVCALAIICAVVATLLLVSDHAAKAEEKPIEIGVLALAGC